MRGLLWSLSWTSLDNCTDSWPYGLCYDHYVGPLWRTVQLVSHTVFVITILDLSGELCSQIAIRSLLWSIFWTSLVTSGNCPYLSLSLKSMCCWRHLLRLTPLLKIKDFINKHSVDFISYLSRVLWVTIAGLDAQNTIVSWLAWYHPRLLSCSARPLRAHVTGGQDQRGRG